MKFLILVLLIGSVANGLPNPEDDDDTRIVEGIKSPTMIPYICSIRRFQGFVCGCSILDQSTVLTAAHCLTQPATEYSIGVGSTQLDQQTIYPVLAYVNHENYNKTYRFNSDVAVIKLQQPIKLKPGLVEAINLPTFCEDFFPYGERGTIAGWGYRQENIKKSVNDLHEVQVDILRPSDPSCKFYAGANQISPTSFCAGNADASGNSCRGDSGGPLTIVNGENNDAKELCGIVSWGNGCNRRGVAKVYTNVCSVITWIQKTWAHGFDDIVTEKPNYPAQAHEGSYFSRPNSPAINQGSSNSYHPPANQGSYFSNPNYRPVNQGSYLTNSPPRRPQFSANWS